ncbi:hypothetical protein SAMN04488007_2070 [Maribacter aquivivus]|uniref:Uncharacterized protein n=1 Tax=Maribacter aquivivus TaxID=228958 RepID=A0A1M6NIS3_9FLAO|nr:hypothetical protein [Maribacter aquivivus]SHJ95631.1 hypothetical protein SAMN04488007_2070 [Maribacter aquivivus]
MIASKHFYPHESDKRIMMKKDRLEINNWTDELEFLNKEIEFYLDIEDSMIHSSKLYQELHGIRRENALMLAALYRYDNAVSKSIECDTIACDAYYLNHHEKKRDAYLSLIENYRSLKIKILSQILINARS